MTSEDAHAANATYIASYWFVYVYVHIHVYLSATVEKTNIHTKGFIELRVQITGNTGCLKIASCHMYSKGHITFHT